MDLPLLDKASPRSLVDQIVEHFRVAIEDQRLQPGDRLPTIREIASHGAVTRNTVQDAYGRLREMGLVAATVGRGTVVAQRPHTGSRAVLQAISPGATAAYRHLLHSQPPAAPAGQLICNFAELNPDQSLFPAKAFGESISRVLASRGPQLLGYGEPAGDPALRARLAAMTGDETGDPDDVLVTNGAQQGIDLVLRTFTRPGDRVAVAIPTYHHLFGLLKAHDLAVVPVRGDRGVLDLDHLRQVIEENDPRLLYVMPTFHNPTGHTMQREQREALMAVMQGTRVPILEDEFELDLRFRGDRLASLRSMDERDLTVTVRTFSKGLFPAVRLGWLHAAPEVLGPMSALKRYIDLESSPLLQAALCDFLETGAAREYLTRLRAAVQARHAAAANALREHMPEGFTWTDPDGGFLRWLEGPTGFDGDALARAAAAEGVLVTPGRLFYQADAARGAPVAGVRLSVARADESSVAEGIRILARCAGELLGRAGSASLRPLIL